MIPIYVTSDGGIMALLVNIVVPPRSMPSSKEYLRPHVIVDNDYEEEDIDWMIIKVLTYPVI